MYCKYITLQHAKPKHTYPFHRRQLLQVFAIEFGDFAIEFGDFAIEFVPFAIELNSSAIEFVGFAIEFVPFAIEFVAFAVKFSVKFVHNKNSSWSKHDVKPKHTYPFHRQQLL